MNGMIPEQRLIGARIRDLDPIEHLDVIIGPGVNVLYGLNGVGKSRLLRALSLDHAFLRGSTVELHMSAPPGPIDTDLIDAWLTRVPGNPWNLLLRPEASSDRFPGVRDRGPVAHLLIPVYEATRAILDALPDGLPRHAEAVVFRLLEETARTPDLVAELRDSTTLRRFISAALEVARDGRFIIRVDQGFLTLELATALPDRHTVLGQLIEEARNEFLARVGVSHERYLEEHLGERISAGLAEDLQFPDDDFVRGAVTEMIEAEWESVAIESCFHPLLRAGLTTVLSRTRIDGFPGWYSASVLTIHAPPRHGEPLGATVMPEWQMQDLDDLQRYTFHQLPPLLNRIGGSTAPDQDFGIITTGDGGDSYITNEMNETAVLSIEALANSIYGLLMDDAPRLEIIQRSPAGETRFFIWGLLDWTAIEPLGTRVHVSDLSDARRRWAVFSINLALSLREEVREHARLVLIDEPERGLHRTAERRLAGGLQRLARDLGLTIVVATHSPSFMRLPRAAAHHLRRDSTGHLVVEDLDLEGVDLDPLGLDLSDRAQFLQALVLVPDELDAAALSGFLGESEHQEGIMIRKLSDASPPDRTLNDEAPNTSDQVEHDLLDLVIRMTDARIIAVCDAEQFVALLEDPDGTVEPWHARPFWWRMPDAYEMPRLFNASRFETIEPDPEVNDDTWTALTKIDQGEAGEVIERAKHAPEERWRARMHDLQRRLVRLQATRRAQCLTFDRRDFVKSLTFPANHVLGGPEATATLSSAWSVYYATRSDHGATEGISSQVGEVVDAESFRRAASCSDMVPYVVVDLLDIIMGTHPTDGPLIPPYMSLDELRASVDPWWDVPF